MPNITVNIPKAEFMVDDRHQFRTTEQGNIIDCRIWFLQDDGSWVSTDNAVEVDCTELYRAHERYEATMQRAKREFDQAMQEVEKCSELALNQLRLVLTLMEIAATNLTNTVGH